MTAGTLISDYPIACLFAGLLAVGAFLALLACCRIAELEKAESLPSASTACPGQAAGEVGPSPVSEGDGA